MQVFEPLKAHAESEQDLQRSADRRSQVAVAAGRKDSYLQLQRRSSDRSPNWSYDSSSSEVLAGADHVIEPLLEERERLLAQETEGGL